jgi:cytochrome c peroxidase
MFPARFAQHSITITGRHRLGTALRLLAFGAALTAAGVRADPDRDALADLGRRLFFDANLSQYRTQSCATCHDPARAFSDGRDNGVDGAASLGDDGRSLGDRNTPTAAYASMAPSFHKNDEGHYIGGLFHDGRAATLAVQAVQPMLNPIEMGLPDSAAVLARMRADPVYVQGITERFGADVLKDPARTMAAIGECISAFEQTGEFAPFDSKYDRFLRGEYRMSALEEMGRSVFFSPMTNCSNCHLLNISTLDRRETFTNYRYHNIGLPPNTTLRNKNGLGTDHRDRGLLDHPAVDDPALAGKFKVPTLRNIAVTGPYMHNGVFRELRTAIRFYNHYIVRSKRSRTNPETDLPWGAAAFPDTVDLDLLSEGQPIDNRRIEALIAFLRTLTDARYEPLLGSQPIARNSVGAAKSIEKPSEPGTPP